MRKLKKHYAYLVVFLVLLLWSLRGVEFDLKKLIQGIPFMLDFLKRMFPPSFDVELLYRVFKEVLVTIQIAFVGTVLAAIVAAPMSFLAAKNMISSKAMLWFVRLFLNANRAIDVMIFALFFVSAVGLGPFPGMLAVAAHSVGVLGQLFYQAIESVDKGQVEAIKSVGASQTLILRWSVWPQVFPRFVSYFLMRFELNVRSAVVLGVVGAGGVGFLLQTYMRLFQYQNVATVVLVILFLVMGIDVISSKLRAKLE